MTSDLTDLHNRLLLLRNDLTEIILDLATRLEPQPPRLMPADRPTDQETRQ